MESVTSIAADDDRRRSTVRLNPQLVRKYLRRRKLTLVRLSQLAGIPELSVANAAEGKPIGCFHWFCFSSVLRCQPENILCRDDQVFLGFEQLSDG